MDYTRPEDVECPYCGHGQNINHDDGYGREEEELHQQTCTNCEKEFGFETSVSFHYEAKKVPCFNDAECEWVKSGRSTVEGVYDIQHWRCKYCGNSRDEHLEVLKCT